MGSVGCDGNAGISVAAIRYVQSRCIAVAVQVSFWLIGPHPEPREQNKRRARFTSYPKHENQSLQNENDKLPPETDCPNHEDDNLNNVVSYPILKFAEVSLPVNRL